MLPRALRAVLALLPAAAAIGPAPAASAGDPTPDERYLALLAKAAPDDARAQHDLGLWCLRHLLPERARERFRRVVEIEPDHEEARRRTGFVRRAGRWLPAAAAVREEVGEARAALPAGDAAALLAFADRCVALGAFDDAEEAFRGVLAKDPANGRAASALASEPSNRLERAVAEYLSSTGGPRARAWAAIDAAPPLEPAEVPAWTWFVRNRLRRLPRHGGGEVSTVRFPGGSTRYRVIRRREGLALSMAVLLHGGGPSKAVNDGAWENLAVYGEFAPFDLLAIPRAADDSTGAGWIVGNGPAAVDAVVREVLRAHPVDTDRVAVHGYSMGGYGAGYLATRSPDRYAAIFVGAAGWPAGGARAGNLLPVPVLVHIGADDTESDHVGTSREFRDLVEAERRRLPWGFPLEYREYPGVGHQLPASSHEESMEWIARRTRDPAPPRVIWEPNPADAEPGRPISCFWLEAEGAVAGARVEAVVADDLVSVESKGVKGLTVHLDGRLVDLDWPVTVRHNGRTAFAGRLRPRLAFLVRTFEARDDPRLVFPCGVRLKR